MASPQEHASLWIGQIVLACIFLAASYVKTSTPAADLMVDLPWTAAFPMVLVRLIGVAEGLGALGLVLPALLRIRPALTPLAAAGLTLLMVCAAVFHLIRGEPGAMGGVLILAVLTGGIAWGRTYDAPIVPRDDDDDEELANW